MASYVPAKRKSAKSISALSWQSILDILYHFVVGGLLLGVKVKILLALPAVMKICFVAIYKIKVKIFAIIMVGPITTTTKKVLRIFFKDCIMLIR